MGNTAEIPEHVSARFASCELDVICKRFEILSEIGSFRGKSFDRKTFQRNYVKGYPEIADLLFNGLDKNGNGKIDLAEFVTALCYCIRGSKEEKLNFVFDMFEPRRTAISKSRFAQVIQSDFFGQLRESSKAKQLRVQKTTETVFTKYDKTNTGSLNRKEFVQWAENAPEIERIFTLFNTIDNELTKNIEEKVSAPTQVTHAMHAQQTENGIQIDNIPADWIVLLKQAKISRKELADPEVAAQILGIIADRLNTNAIARASAPSLPSHLQPAPTTPTRVPTTPPHVPTPTTPTTPTTTTTDTAPPPAATIIPPPPTDTAPPPPAPVQTEPLPEVVTRPHTPPRENKPALTPIIPATTAPAPPVPEPEAFIAPEETEEEEEKFYTPVGTPAASLDNVVPPPAPVPVPPQQTIVTPSAPVANAPAPPPVPDATPIVPITREPSLLDAIHSVKLEKAEPIQKPEEPANALLREIKQGTFLKHVDPSEINQLSEEDRNDLASVLARAMQTHRKNLKADVEREEDDDWDDWD